MAFLNTQNLPAGHNIVIALVDAFEKGERFYLITNANEAIFQRKDVYLNTPFRNEDEPGYSLSQFIVPLASLPWLVDIIENKFWKKPSQGGAPADVLHYKNTVEGEALKIRYSPNCRKEFEPGITITNFARPDGRSRYSKIGIPYYTLKDKGLLAAMKSV